MSETYAEADEFDPDLIQSFFHRAGQRPDPAAKLMASLLREIFAMEQFARTRGIVIPDSVRSDLPALLELLSDKGDDGEALDLDDDDVQGGTDADRS
ncbi:hypothetical protein [Maricaulis parjimensis]|uniref:hypothetical protein n=1 Tax=Maricaulis parjimensis TaxID=144023 RepID=UPI00193945D2|nr:hypothetical protein [Maricaulis parjimensis]